MRMQEGIQMKRVKKKTLVFLSRSILRFIWNEKKIDYIFRAVLGARQN